MGALRYLTILPTADPSNWGFLAVSTAGVYRHHYDVQTVEDPAAIEVFLPTRRTAPPPTGAALRQCLSKDQLLADFREKSNDPALAFNKKMI